MFRFLFLLLFCSTSSLLSSQCLKDYYQKKAIEKNPEITKEIERFYHSIQPSSNTKRVTKYIVPVVFHVIHTNGIENISKAQIENQMFILNQNYSNNHPNKNNIRNPFKSVAADCQIEFRLAKIDPDGNCTDGINRVYSPLHINATDDVKDVTGARWDNTKYLNIWVVSSIGFQTPGGQGVAGYSYLPSTISFGNSGIDGIVILHNCVGTIGTGRADLLGNVLTHEVGHFLGLEHTFQDACNGNINGDYCDDTPPVSSEFINNSCPTNGNSCHTDNPDLIDQWENYMDYSHGGCQCMFSLNQKDIMHTTFTYYNFRTELVSAANNKATGVELSNDIPIAAIGSNTRKACVGEAVTYYNNSCKALTKNSTWEFDAANISTSNKDTATVFYSTPGFYKVKLTVSNDYGSSQIIADQYIEIKPAIGFKKPAVVESFEDPNWLNTSGWEIWKQGDYQFKTETGVAYSGSKCLVAPINGFVTKSQLFELVSPAIDLRPLKGKDPKISMMVAYVRQSLSSTEKFRLFISVGCGENWVLLLQKSANNLAYNSSIYTTNFIPKDASQWQLISQKLYAYENDSNVRFKIQVESGETNSVFIDNINISEYNTGLSAFEKLIQLVIFPTPANQNLNIIYENEVGETEVWLESTLGEKIVQISEKHLQSGVITINWTQNNLCSTGVYLLKIRANNQVITKKIIFAN